MAKIKEWEYDDVMHDYIRYTEELEELMQEDEPDEEEIEEIKKIIADFEDVLFNEEDF